MAFNSRGKTSLQVSWKAPEESLQNVELTGYQICFYAKDTAPECLVLTSTKVLSLTLNNLLPSTKYFVTVSASTKAGSGERSLAVSKITNGGNLVNMNSWPSLHNLDQNIVSQKSICLSIFAGYSVL